MKELIVNTINLIVNKLMSARFIIAVSFAITLCYLAKVEPSVRDAFFAMAGAAIRDYFGRHDRTRESADVPKP